MRTLPEHLVGRQAKRPLDDLFHAAGELPLTIAIVGGNQKKPIRIEVD